MQRKRKLSVMIGSLAIVIAAAILIGVIAGGGKDEIQEPTAPEKDSGSAHVDAEMIAGQMRDYALLIGVSDAELVERKGQGETSYQEGSKVLNARVYTETLFGILGEAAFVYGDDGFVNEVVFNFFDSNAGDVINFISQELGDAESVEHNGESTAALWHLDGYAYQLYDEADIVYLIVSREYEG